MFFQIYNLIINWLYSGGTITPEIEMTATLLSTIGVIFILVVPFIVVFFTVRLIFRALER